MLIFRLCWGWGALRLHKMLLVRCLLLLRCHITAIIYTFLKAATLVSVVYSKCSRWSSRSLCVDKWTISIALAFSYRRWWTCCVHRISVNSRVSPCWHILTSFRMTFRLVLTSVQRERGLRYIWCLEGTIEILKATSTCHNHTILVTTEKHVIEIRLRFMHRRITSLIIPDIKSTWRL